VIFLLSGREGMLLSSVVHAAFVAGIVGHKVILLMEELSRLDSKVSLAPSRQLGEAWISGKVIPL
jgi:hypothetical protein